MIIAMPFVLCVTMLNEIAILRLSLDAVVAVLQETIGFAVDDTLGLLEQRCITVSVAIGAIGMAVGMAVAAVRDTCLLGSSLDTKLLGRIVRVTSVAAVDVCLKTSTLTGIGLACLLMHAQSLLELSDRDVIQKCAASQGVGHSQAEQTIASLEDGRSALVYHVVIEQGMVNGESSSRKEVEEALVLSIGE